MIDPRIWNDQAEFNRQLRPEPPLTHEELAEITKEFTLHQMTEMAEFLEAGKVWGQHRRRPIGLINRENVRRQLIDQFKYWMGIAQAWGFELKDLERTYWMKSATVRQRYAEEWLTSIADQPIVVLDLDNVLCDYTEGFFQWLKENVMAYADSEVQAATWRTDLEWARKRRVFFSGTELGILNPLWNKIQHDFRSHGQFTRLPAMPYAREFVDWCRSNDWAVVALTSRPIDEYPNLYDDTVYWLTEQQLTVDRIWWGPNKGEKLSQVIPRLQQVRFVVEDDWRYVEQLDRLGVGRIYWYQQEPSRKETGTKIVTISRLEEIIEREDKKGRQMTL